MKKTHSLFAVLIVVPFLASAQTDRAGSVQPAGEVSTGVTPGDQEATDLSFITAVAADNFRGQAKEIEQKVYELASNDEDRRGKGKGKGNGNSKGNSNSKSKEDREKAARQEAAKEARIKEREREERKAAAAAAAKNRPAPAKKMITPPVAPVQVPAVTVETKADAKVGADAPAKPEMKADAKAETTAVTDAPAKPEMKTAKPAPTTPLPGANAEARAKAIAAARAKAAADAKKGKGKPRNPNMPRKIEEPSPAVAKAAAEDKAREAKRRASGRNKDAAEREKRQEERAMEARIDAKVAAAVAARDKDPEKSKDVVARILGVAGVAVGLNATVKANRNQQEIRRIEAESIGRTEREREQSVDYLVHRFRGEQVDYVPPGYQSPYRDSHDQRGVPPHFREQGRKDFDGHRHVRYQNREEIPAILLASSTLNRVNIVPVQERYRDAPQPQSRFPRAEEIPQAYQAPSALDLSYKVDADSEITQDDILFLQGSTAFADDYSNDIVLDLAYAMQDPSLSSMSFVVEGHASAEGSYELNLDLSQRRAERIVREMVAAGVSPQRLVPVGYGESEAYYAADADESQRRFDRKVVVFRLDQ